MKLKKKSKDLGFILGLGGTAKGVGCFFGLGAMTLQNMKKPGPIGGPVKKSNLVDGTALIYFATEDSVSELITQLTKMRKDMKAARTGINKKVMSVPHRYEPMRPISLRGCLGFSIIWASSRLFRVVFGLLRLIAKLEVLGLRLISSDRR